jgi:hypothetical protein
VAETLRVAGLATNGAYGTAFLAGATLTLASNLLIGVAPVTTGDVVIANGAITCTNVDASGFLDLSSGSLTLEGGSLAVDRLRLTNHAGQLRFNAGILHSADSVVANGLPFVIGDGVRPAVFVLGPGLHAFQDGLVVSSNATLTGCGQIVGTVLNQGGTITTSNCSPSGSPPHILQPPVSLTVTQNATAGFSVSADGTPAPTYQWRFTPPGGVETDLPGATGAALTIASAQAADIGTYRVIANNPSGSASASATLRVLVPPTLAGSRSPIPTQLYSSPAFPC